MNESAADLLDDPDEDLPVDRDLLLALAAASSGNPAGTPTAQLERYLEHCHVLNRAELFGLFRAIMEGPELPRSVAYKCQVAALKYLSRTDLNSCFKKAMGTKNEKRNWKGFCLRSKI